MPHPQDARALRCEFERSYALSRSPLVRELERSVCGCDYGATSWTSRDEAERIAEWLRLGPGVHLLEVGAGSGWPGLYFAKTTRCNVTLADVPFTGLRVARERASEDGLGNRITVVAADGANLPFRDGMFAAISHSDVLCCMPAKLAMLRECRRIARAGARMAFSVIALSRNLSEPDRRRAMDSGPPFVECHGDYSALLSESGWEVLEHVDATTGFIRAMRALLDGMRLRTDAFTELLGRDEFTERAERRHAALVATIDGLLKRELFVAVPSAR